MRLLIANPGAETAIVRATYQRQDGGRVVKVYRVAANSRQTVNVAQEDASLANAALAITLGSNNPVVVERTTWWGANGTLDEALSAGGTTSGGARWLLAEGELGGSRQASTSITIFNQGVATDVVVTLLFEDGPEASATFAVGAGGQFSVPLEDAFAAAAGRRFSVVIEAVDPDANLVVDRRIFWLPQGGRSAGAEGAAARMR